MTENTFCPLCRIATSLLELSELVELIPDDADDAHNQLQKIGDDLCACLEHFDDSDRGVHAVRHWHEH